MILVFICLIVREKKFRSTPTLYWRTEALVDILGQMENEMTHQPTMFTLSTMWMDSARVWALNMKDGWGRSISKSHLNKCLRYCFPKTEKNLTIERNQFEETDLPSISKSGIKIQANPLHQQLGCLKVDPFLRHPFPSSIGCLILFVEMCLFSQPIEGFYSNCAISIVLDAFC